MDFTIATFVVDFPEFSDTAIYPLSTVTFYAGLAQRQVRQCVWGDSYSYGVSLYLAHCLVIRANDAKAAKAGGLPGTFGGVATAKTVGSVSVGYDSANTSEKDAGWWNLTTYGKEFFRLTRIFGAGVIQL